MLNLHTSVSIAVVVVIVVVCRCVSFYWLFAKENTNGVVLQPRKLLFEGLPRLEEKSGTRGKKGTRVREAVVNVAEAW